MSDAPSHTADPPWAAIAPKLRDFALSDAPMGPGCYIMRDPKGKAIYVGKAKNLRARLRSYLNESDTRYTVKFLMARVANIECLITSNEKEAVLLENSLIKQYKPRYNVQLKDDKTYVSLKLNVTHEYPRLTVTRKIRRDGSKYFGPYSSAGAVRDTIRQFQRMFPLRLCSDGVLNNRTRPCLYYQMKQCCAPCVGLADKAEYRDIVRQVELALAGRSDELRKELTARIKEHADRLEFEEAALLRDRLRNVEKTLERQSAVAAGEGGADRDVFGVHRHGRYAEVQVVYYRSGKMTGGRAFSVKDTEMPLEETFGSFLLQYYAGAAMIPEEVLTPVELEEAEALGEILAERRGKRVEVHWPQRGEKLRLVELAGKNAKHSFEEKRLAEQANKDLILHVQEKLGLEAAPRRIECFDIATTQGAKTVGSMVVFENGDAAKGRYRRYAVKGEAGQDDFASMRQVLLRRYTRAIEENDLPDLVLIDGGRGQLGVARAVLEDLGIEHIGLASIAKSRAQEDGGRSPERFFRPGRSNPIVLPQHSPVVHYLARIRDEAHRFANTYHRKKRNQGALRTSLTEIPGVGGARARRLLQEFGSVARIQAVAPEAIAALPGFSEPLARTIHAYLKSPGDEQAAEKDDAMMWAIAIVAGALIAGALVAAGVWAFILADNPDFERCDEVHEAKTGDLWAIKLFRHRAKHAVPGEPVLLCHGAFANHHSFDVPHGASLAEYLSEAGYDVWLLDYRGCRSATAPFGHHKARATLDDYLLEDLPAAVDYILNETAQPRLHAIGHSLGGMLLYAYDLEFRGHGLASLTAIGSPIAAVSNLIAEAGANRPRHPWLVWSIQHLPWVAGPAHRFLCYQATRVRHSSPLFPVNWDNAHPDVGTREMLHIADVMPGPCARALDGWMSGDPWVMAGGRLAMGERLPELCTPPFLIYARRDLLTPPHVVRPFFEAIKLADKGMLMLRNAAETADEYDHIDLVLGKHAPEDVFAPIVEWLAQHPIADEVTGAESAEAGPADWERSGGEFEDAIEAETLDATDMESDEILVDPERTMEANLVRQRQRLGRLMEDIQDALGEGEPRGRSAEDPARHSTHDPAQPKGD